MPEPDKYTFRVAEGGLLLPTRKPFRPGEFFEVPAGTVRDPESLAQFIKQKEREIMDKAAREMSPMERLLKDAALLRDAHYNVVHRLQVIRENMTGVIPDNHPGEEKVKTEGSGSFGVLQDRLSEMDGILNGTMNEVARIEKAMGISPEVACPTPPPSRIGR